MANDYLQNTTQKTRATRTPLKTGGEIWCSGKIGSAYSTYATHCITLDTNPDIDHERGKDKMIVQAQR